MKKRSQVPNAKTFTVIFRGCALSPHPKLAVAEATRIYNSMMTRGSIQPNTIHMNAVLEVCARALDLDSLFTILSTANVQLRRPDALTYTIVLNALRHDSASARTTNLGLVDKDARSAVQDNIFKGSNVWADAIADWRSGKVIVDEHLVCAMGRLLVMGESKDNESVLELLEQTMQIPRFDKPNVKLPGAVADPDPTPEAASSTGTEAAVVSPEPEPERAMDTTNMSPKARSKLARSTAKSSPLYAKPGVKTVSLAMTALTNLRKTGSAAKYWSYLTHTLNITPDPENYFCYLRALAVGHASGHVADLIKQMPKEFLGPVTFRRGFSACIGDNLNPSAFHHACRIFDVMTTKQRYPDALAMRLFLQTARANTRHFYDQTPGSPDATTTTSSPTKLATIITMPTKGEVAHGEQIAAAIDRMWDPIHILFKSASFPAGPPSRSPAEELDKKRGDMQEIMATARRMIAAIDRAVTGRLVVDKEPVSELRVRRAVLQRVLERWILKLYPNGAPADLLPDGKGDSKKDSEKREVLDVQY
jgi:hypothetical protein